MQPLFAHQPVLLSVLLVSLLIWRVMEASVGIRTHKRLRAGAWRQDRGSQAVLYVLLIGGILLGTLLAFTVPATAITVLGAFFTTAVAVASEQTVIETGPYRLIRHPSYTGFLVTLLGFGLSLTNWLSLLVLVGCALIGFRYRIHVEERVLQEHLGQRYQEYMRRTKRLIPFVL